SACSSAPLSSMSTRNKQAIHTVSAAGAHSKDGKFTARGHSEPTGITRVTKAPKAVSTGVAGLTATLKASGSKDTAVLTVSSNISVSSLLPEELGEPEKQRWLEDHEVLISVHSELSIEDDWSTVDERIVVPAFDGVVADRDAAAAIRDSAQYKWDN